MTRRRSTNTDDEIARNLVEVIRAYWEMAGNPIEIGVVSTPRGLMISSRTLYGLPVSAAEWNRARAQGLTA